MDKDAGDTGLLGGTQHLNGVAVVGMHATTAKKGDEVEPALLRRVYGAA